MIHRYEVIFQPKLLRGVFLILGLRQYVLVLLFIYLNYLNDSMGGGFDLHIGEYLIIL
jgi:hypothetical protein